jgi:hypothetical protein
MLALAGLSSGGMSAAHAATGPAGHPSQSHPRRTEVNNRLAHQDERIHRQRASGQMSAERARELHRQDRKIRLEERGMASRDGTHITRTEQGWLNRQENVVGSEIGQ